METHQTRDEYDRLTARAVVTLGSAGTIISHAVRASTGLKVLNDNSSMVAFLLVWLSGPMRPGEIAEAMDITTGGSTKIVTKLESSGLVWRNSDIAADGRAVLVTLTEEGERTAATALAAVGEAVRDLMGHLEALEGLVG